MIKIAIFPFTQTNFVDPSLTHRQIVLETIRKLRRGESFEAYKEKFLIEENIEISDDELKKLYISYSFLDSIIRKLVSYCPNLENVKTRSNKKRKLIQDALETIEWKSIENENYDTLESDGDTFFEIYFNDEYDTIPRLRVLDSKNMLRALKDDKNRYTQYVYREYVEDFEADVSTGSIMTKLARERIIVFERGRKLIFDPLSDEKGNVLKDEDGYIKYGVQEIPNRDSYIDDFPLVHIKGYKKQREEFSDIPAERYIDPSLTLDQITSDFRQINRMLGYPLIMIIDGQIISGSKKRTPGAILGIQSISDSDHSAKVQDIQISNKLDSLFREFTIVRDDLFDKAGLINPSLQQKLNIDSSRVIQQLNLPSENKIELYVDNTISSMKLWFKILLRENDMYNEKTDKDLSFEKPKFIIKSSPFDKLLYEQSEIKSGRKSRQEIYIENGDLDEDINLRKKEINEETIGKNEDMAFAENEVSDRVSNGQNVDKNFINT